MAENEAVKKTKMQLFRYDKAPELVEAGIMELKPYSEAQKSGITRMVEAGYIEGGETRVLFNIPGFSLVYAWFKPGYPLPLHSHDTDCLYYIVAGSIQLGTETLGPRDGFFIKADVPYTYKAGADGVEILEFRHGGGFDFVNLAKNQAFYDKAIESITSNLESWKTVQRPSESSR